MKAFKPCTSPKSNLDPFSKNISFTGYHGKCSIIRRDKKKQGLCDLLWWFDSTTSDFNKPFRNYGFCYIFKVVSWKMKIHLKIEMDNQALCVSLIFNKINHSFHSQMQIYLHVHVYLVIYLSVNRYIHILALFQELYTPQRRALLYRSASF